MVNVAFILGVAMVSATQQPTFKSGIELVAVDVHVVDRHGKPIEDMKANEFEVTIGGTRRRVTSVELVRYHARETSATTAAPPPATETPAAAPRPRRMYVLAVDEHSLHASNALAAVNAAERFLDRLQPDDLVGLVAYPTGAAQHDLTSDHAAVRRVLRSIKGLFEEPVSKFRLTPSEIIDIASGDTEAAQAVVRRECGGRASMGCSALQIRHEAISLVGSLEMRVSQSVGGLRSVVRSLEKVPGRKTLVMVSGGLIATDRAGGRMNANAEVAALAREAASSNLSVYALHLDWSFLEALSSRGGLRTSFFRDSNMAATGLQIVAGTAGGTVLRVQGTSPDTAFDRVLRETSAHYLLGVEIDPSDRNGRSHSIRVKATRRNVEVRSRTEVLIPRR